MGLPWILQWGLPLLSAAAEMVAAAVVEGLVAGRDPALAAAHSTGAHIEGGTGAHVGTHAVHYLA